MARPSRKRLTWDGFKREVLNVPNMITVGRVFLIPPVLILVDTTDPVRNFYAMLLFALASILDLLDGYLARRQGLVTVFGKFVDPLADKIMVMSVLVYLVYVGFMTPWVVVVLLGRDIYISGLRSLAGAEGIVIAAGTGGKLKTAFQLIGISCVLVHYRYRLLGTDIMVDYHQLGMAFVYLSLVLSIVSAFQYTAGFRQSLGEPRDA